MLFVIGLLTSVHCVAMCGGINLSQCISGAGGQGRFSGFWPSIKYNLGRVVSYTVIGGIVGALGSVVQFSGTARGIMQLMAGVFMVFMGLSLSGLVPALARFTPHLPKALGIKIAKEKKRGNSPLYVGLLNGLMPCGPLQAMQLYALSTGSLWGGALSMLLFSLGTVPLMFLLGALSSILSRKFTRYMVTAGAVLVLVMGISMFQNGLALSGINVSSGVAQSEAVQTGGNAENTQTDSSSAAQQSSNENVQEIASTLTGYGYPAITVKAGIPVKWTISASKGSLNGCNSRLTIPEYKIEKQLAAGDNVIEFTPTRTGTFTYSCWMGMIRSTIRVVENDAAQAAPSGSSAGATAPSATDDPGVLPVTAGGCCGSGIGGPQATNAPDTQPIAPGGCCGIH
jgi:sulfite exporter TauE/SafE